MALDTVELLMAFEETFDLEIPDEDAERIVTIRDVVDYVYARVPHSEWQVCRTQRAFYRLRSTLRDQLGDVHVNVRPKTPWDSLIPVEQRRALWQQLGQATGARNWPELERSGNAKRAIALLVLTSAVVVYTASPAYSIAAALLAAIAAGWVGLKATQHLRVQFADNRATVGDVAQLLAIDLPSQWRPAESGWTREQVRLVVRSITKEHLNIDVPFSDDAAFVDDLGAD